MRWNIKKTTLILFLLLSFASSSQYYKFDSVTRYSGKWRQQELEILTYTNSENDNYYLRLSYYTNGWEAILYDLKNRKQHYFKVSEVKVKDGFSTIFKYYDTAVLHMTGHDIFSNYIFDFTTIEKKDNLKKVKLSVYKNSKRKKLIANYDLELRENSTNLFPAFRVSCMHPYEFTSRLTLNENYIVVSSAAQFNVDGHVVQNRLIDYKEVDLILQIP